MAFTYSAKPPNRDEGDTSTIISKTPQRRFDKNVTMIKIQVLLLANHCDEKYDPHCRSDRFLQPNDILATTTEY